MRKGGHVGGVGGGEEERGVKWEVVLFGWEEGVKVRGLAT